MSDKALSEGKWGWEKVEITFIFYGLVGYEKWKNEKG